METYRLKYHLMPPQGWMNDPNGLCVYGQYIHVFFQYSPEEVLGGQKVWGHYVSQDFLHWSYEGIAIQPDTPWDRDGAFSGSALTEDGKLELFYTGNVQEEGQHDYITSGMEGNTIYTVSEDGIHFGKKELLLSNKDYPASYSCQIRDPKVWKKKDAYYMVLGGRKLDGAGAVLQYSSRDKKQWEFAGEFTTTEPFGYMWECPDVFSLEGQTVVMCCPQGVKRERYRYQNIHQVGYFLVPQEPEAIAGQVEKENFVEWDFGWDFYAPQTFLDQKGRRIMIGWAGMSDMELEFHNQPTICQGWQHALSVPRELHLKQNQLYQYPIEEIKQLRGKRQEFTQQIHMTQTEAADIEIDFCNPEEEKEINIDEAVHITFGNGVLRVEHKEESGCGRRDREIKLKQCTSFRILKDVSMLEIFVNQGQAVFTTRYYTKDPKETCIFVKGQAAGRAWSLEDAKTK